MNLGNEFYLIRFKDEQNYIKILQGGPWFIGKHLLTIGHWEPKLMHLHRNACKQLFGLGYLHFLRSYEPQLLQKISTKLGTLLKIDAHTNDTLRD